MHAVVNKFIMRVGCAWYAHSLDNIPSSHTAKAVGVILFGEVMVLAKKG